MRDPRIDPRTHDRVRSRLGGSSRTVVYVSPSGYVVYDTDNEPAKDQQTIALRTWRRWAKDGSVLRCGPEGLLHPYKREIVCHYALQGQILRLANRAARKHKISTPDEEALLTLLELGLERVLTSPEEEKRFMKAMADRLGQPVVGPAL